MPASDKHKRKTFEVYSPSKVFLYKYKLPHLKANGKP